MTHPSDIAGLSESKPLRRDYLEMMRAHVDEDGKLSHRNGVDLLAEVERQNTAIDSLSARVRELERNPPLLDARSIPGVDELVRSLEARALRAEQQRDEAYERAAKCAEDFPVAMMTMWERPGGPPGNGYRNSTHADIAAAIRRLTAASDGEVG